MHSDKWNMTIVKTDLSQEWLGLCLAVRQESLKRINKVERIVFGRRPSQILDPVR